MTEAVALLQWQEQGIVANQNKLANFVQQLQSTLDINREGIPLQYIDPTVIASQVPYYDNAEDIPEEVYKEAIVKIDFEDGIPVANGLPLWERLDGETIPYYKLFKEYRDMKYYELKDTSINNKASYTDTNTVTETRTIIGTRSLARLSEHCGVPGKLLNILARIYHWMMRVKCFDMQKEREIALKRQRRAEELEYKHSRAANELLEQAMKYIKEHPAQLNPKVAIQMVELGMKYGRISAGLLGDKPGTQSSVAHQTNIAISQSSTHNQADQMVIANMGSDNQGYKDGRNISDVERRMADSMKDNSNLMSIINVLNRSGALSAAIKKTDNDVIEFVEDEEEGSFSYDDEPDVEEILNTSNTSNTSNINNGRNVVVPLNRGDSRG